MLQTQITLYTLFQSYVIIVSILHTLEQNQIFQSQTKLSTSVKINLKAWYNIYLSLER